MSAENGTNYVDYALLCNNGYLSIYSEHSLLNQQHFSLKNDSLFFFLSLDADHVAFCCCNPPYQMDPSLKMWEYHLSSPVSTLSSVLIGLYYQYSPTLTGSNFCLR